MRTFLLMVLLAALAAASTAASPTVSKGEQLFKSTCKSCHSIGKGKVIGPDLKNVHERRKEEWLVAFIASPKRMEEKGDPIAKKLIAEHISLMPNHDFFSEEEIKSILAYIEDRSTKKEVVINKDSIISCPPIPEKPESGTMETPFMYILLGLFLLVILYSLYVLLQLIEYLTKEKV